jgi:hypothetical protein
MERQLELAPKQLDLFVTTPKENGQKGGSDKIFDPDEAFELGSKKKRRDKS